MLSLFKKEVNAFFSNLSAYLITAVFLVSLGLIVWVFPGTSVLDYGYADLEPLFSYTPFVFIFLLYYICCDCPCAIVRRFVAMFSASLGFRFDGSGNE